MDRRTFLKASAAGAAAAAAGGIGLEATAMAEGLPRRTLGKTGEKLSIIGFGGIVAMGVEQPEATRTVHAAIAEGVNYFDVAPTYGNGEAEEKLGPALQGKRDGVFLACKTARRDRKGAEEELHRSLKRLKTDRFDLYQLHALTTDDDIAQVTAPGGALEAFVEAREKGLVRFLGFSAHSVDAAMAVMARFAFDTILFPFNYVTWSQGDFGPQVLKEARRRGMGCLALKAMAHAPWPEGAARDYPNCWYQPETDPDRAALALRFTLSEDITSALPPGDPRLFRMALGVGHRFKRLSRQERADLLASARGVKPIFTHPAA